MKTADGAGDRMKRSNALPVDEKKQTPPTTHFPHNVEKQRSNHHKCDIDRASHNRRFNSDGDIMTDGDDSAGIMGKKNRTAISMNR